MTETYIKILDQFIVKDSLQQWTTKPFNDNGRTFATDGYTIVSIPIIHGYEELEKTGIYFPFTENMKHKIPLSELQDIIKQWPKLESFDEITCEACNGDQEVDYEFEYEYDTYTETLRCPVCNGDGYTSRIPNGKYHNDSTKIFKIGYWRFKLKFIERLLFVAESLNSDIFVVKQDEKINPTYFKIKDTYVLVMPMAEWGELELGYEIKL